MELNRFVPPGEGVVVAVGLGSLAAHSVHGFRASKEATTFVYGIAVPAAISLLLVAGGLWLRESGLSADVRRHVAAWSVGGSIALGLLGAMTVRYQAAEGIRLSDPAYLVVSAGTLGAAFGLLVGLYDGRRHEALSRLAAQKSTSERLNQRLTVLNRVLRHDVRNGVNVIRGHASDLADRDVGGGTGDPPDKVARRLERIREEAETLHTLSEQARAVQQTISGDVSPETVDLASVVEDRLDWLEETYDVSVTTDVPERQRVTANPELDLAVQQLLSNAVEHSDRETPTVETRISTVEAGDAVAGEEAVELVVADDGPGIPDHETQVLEQGSESALEHSDGLGLWLVHWVVTESGGDVRFEDNEPRGSVVRIRLPSADETVDPVDALAIEPALVDD